MDFRNTPEDNAVAEKMVEAIQDSVQGTDWASPEGSIVVDALVIMIHVDGTGGHTTTWINRGSLEAAEGMARRVIRDINKASIAGAISALMDDEDED